MYVLKLHGGLGDSIQRVGTRIANNSLVCGIINNEIKGSKAVDLVCLRLLKQKVVSEYFASLIRQSHRFFLTAPNLAQNVPFIAVILPKCLRPSKF